MAGVAGRRVGRLTVRQVEAEKSRDCMATAEPVLEGGRSRRFQSWIFRHQVSGKVRSTGWAVPHHQPR